MPLLSSAQRVVSGMRVSGKLHLGHLHGVIKNWIALQHQYQCFFFAADWHGLTTHYDDPNIVKANLYEMVIDWLAAGVNPEMATLDCGTLNFGGDDIFINTENDIKYFAEKMNKLGVRYEMECFEKGHIDTTLRFIKKGVIKNHLHYSFVLGVRGGMTGEERDFLFLKDSIPSNATYSVAGIGRYEFSLAELSIKHGGHVRVGLEDNIYIKKGVLTKSNRELVEKVVNLANKYGREVATPQDTRRILEMEIK